MKKDFAIVVLAAGKGTRLQGAVPKPLTLLADGRSILEQQLENIVTVFGAEALKRTFVVVGYKAEKIADNLPAGVTAIHNDSYDVSNTAKSLLRALYSTARYKGVLWMNGDVVFSPLIFGRAISLLKDDISFMVTMAGKTSDEEMKYSLNDAGEISEVSKENTEGAGEAVGINYVSSQLMASFTQALKKTAAQDYFEAAIETTLEWGASWKPLIINDLYAVEIDFAQDLIAANEALKSLH